jgi:Ni,Fe-hydrogenase III component G
MSAPAPVPKPAAPAPAPRAPAPPPIPPMTEGEREMLDALKAGLRDLAEEPRRLAVRRLATRTTPEKVRDSVTMVKSLGCRRLSAISAVDMGDTIDVIYHACAPKGVLVSVRAAVPKKEPRIPTVVDIMPAAALYEREIHDLFGVVFVGNPDLRRLMLHEGWPEGQYPLRKDWKPATTEVEKHA